MSACSSHLSSIQLLPHLHDNSSWIETGWKEKGGKDGWKVEKVEEKLKPWLFSPLPPSLHLQFRRRPPTPSKYKCESRFRISGNIALTSIYHYVAILASSWMDLFIASTPTNGQSSSPCFLPPQEQAWPLFRESLGCLREDLSLNNMVTRFRFRACNFMPTRTVKLFYLYDGDSTTRGDAQSPFRSQIQKNYIYGNVTLNSIKLDNTL